MSVDEAIVVDAMNDIRTRRLAHIVGRRVAVPRERRRSAGLGSAIAHMVRPSVPLAAVHPSRKATPPVAGATGGVEFFGCRQHAASIVWILESVPADLVGPLQFVGGAAGGVGVPAVDHAEEDIAAVPVALGSLEGEETIVDGLVAAVVDRLEVLGEEGEAELGVAVTVDGVADPLLAAAVDLKGLRRQVVVVGVAGVLDTTVGGEGVPRVEAVAPVLVLALAEWSSSARIIWSMERLFQWRRVSSQGLGARLATGVLGLMPYLSLERQRPGPSQYEDAPIYWPGRRTII